MQGISFSGKTRLPAMLVLTLLSACSSTVPLSQQPQPYSLERTPVHRHLVQAWVPLHNAPTAAVARARVNVALMQAKRIADRDLCGDRWTFLGRMGEVLPPELSRAYSPSKQGETWKITLAWSPRLTSCEGVSAGEYFRAVSRTLPEWIALHDREDHAWYRAGVRLSEEAGIQLASASVSVP